MLNQIAPDETDADDATVSADNSSPKKASTAPIFTNSQPWKRTHVIIYVVGPPVNKTLKSCVEYTRVIKEFMKEVYDTDKSAIFYEAQTDSLQQFFPARKYESLPEKPSQVQVYLDGAKPIAREGMIWATIKLGHDMNDELFISDMRNWAGKERLFYKKALQHMKTEKNIWFCLS